MTPWTPTARRELESILDGLRPTLTQSGADPDEVLDDLRRHVSEEASVARLTIVTEADVRRLVERVAPVPRLEDFDRLARRGNGSTPPSPPTSVGPHHQSSTEAKPPVPPAKRPGGRGEIATALLWVFGVVLPVITVIYELATGHCRAEFFDPMPSLWHVLMVAAVPIANSLVLREARIRGGPIGDAGSGTVDSPGEGTEAERRRIRWVWAANGIAVAVSSSYALLFLPMMPAAIIAVILLLGIFALAPFAAWIASLVLRFQLSKAIEPGSERRQASRAWRTGFAVAALALLGLTLPQALTRHYARAAAATEDTTRSTDALRWLRHHGNRDQLLGDCYGRRPGMWTGLIAGNPDLETARRVFFQVTGQPFNAVPAPKSVGSRRMVGFIDNFELGGADWDAGLGGDAVAGLVRGLALASSRIDAVCDPDAAWGYTEWTLEFHNDHAQWQREARAQIQLPPGGVVSRLTLWVNGEEREAAFAGRGETREAYRKVAVVQRRDPVLVTTSGPDRILMQCFPVEPRGGILKVRLGITAPMVLTATNQAVLAWPTFAERNFGIHKTLRHSTWIESSRRPIQPRDGWVESAGSEGRTALRADWSDPQLADPTQAVAFSRSADVADAWSSPRSETGGAWVHARVQMIPPRKPSRLAVVLDGSMSMTEHFPAISKVVESWPKSLLVSIFAAKDGVQRLGPEAIHSLVGEGGQDDVPALLAAWEWAAASPGGQVLWIHGPYPTVIGSYESLRQRLDWREGQGDPTLLDFAVRPGPNRIVEALDGLASLEVVPRLGTMEQDLARLFASWQAPMCHTLFTLQQASENPTPPDPRWHKTSGHLARLWAHSEVRRLWKVRRKAEATALAGRYQLVTPASGAVVLETQTQFTQAGLHPADPATVPVVPEPAIPQLLVAGLLVHLLLNRRTGRIRAR